MHIGVLGPATVSEFVEHLAPSAQGWSPAGTGGIPVNELVRELLRLGHRVTLFTADTGIDRETTLDGTRLRVCIVPLGKPVGRRPARDFFRVERRALGVAIERECPDLLHAHWTSFYALAAQASGLPHVITAHDAPIAVLRREFIPYRIAHTLMAYAVIARARIIISVSPYIASHLRSFMFYRGEKVIIPNGLPDYVFETARPRTTGRQSATFGTVLSGWTRLKNGRAALEAFALVRHAIPDARLVMIGPGHEPGGEASSWARQRNLTEGVQFIGPLSHRAALERVAGEVDVFVHPSLEESFGLTVAEASALGVPVIGGINSGAVPWTLAEGRAGILVDVAQPKALARAMLELVRNPEKQKALSDAGRMNSERFRMSKVMVAHEALYERILRAV
jgi:glycosyltransferase involved in cell wall biosynthesis